MFGYIVINKSEMKFREFDVYRSAYCGLCRELREKYGIAGQLTLTYDLTFVILLLSGLYEPKTWKGTTRCAVHPIQKQPVIKNEFTEYAADMNLLLSYYKCADDWKDDRNFGKLLYSRLLKGGNRKVSASYEKKAERIYRLLEELEQGEKRGEENLDYMSGLFGKIMGEILAVKEDLWEPSLRRMGFFLGKFIYLLDAYEDVEEDKKHGNYNLFAEQYGSEEFEGQVENILTMMMAACCKEFEKLPVLKYGEILRNILYSGVWKRYVEVRDQRRESTGERK